MVSWRFLGALFVAACSSARPAEPLRPSVEPTAPAPVPQASPTPSVRPPLVTKAAPAPERGPEIDRLLSGVANELTTDAPALKSESFSLALVDLKRMRVGHYRGDLPYYPASVVKLAYLAYYEAAKDVGRVTDTPELVRAVKDMIVLSSNDATGFVVDVITDTTSGPELAGPEWETWKTKRNAINAWFRARGYTTLNANQKAFCDGGYGREQAYRDEGRNRNRMTALEAARIMSEIVRGDVASPRLTDEMLTLLARETGDAPVEDAEPEISRKMGLKLPPGSRVWAKSGDAYDVRHLVARVLLPSGGDIVIAAFTQGVARSDGQMFGRMFSRIVQRFEDPGR